MNRPTMPGVNTRAVDLFDPTAPTSYVAVYDDETTGPKRSTREKAEADYRHGATCLTKWQGPTC